MKPFVKWAGGKSRLLKLIEQRLPADFDKWKNVAYVEPFVGGGAVLCHMLENHSNISKVIINDINGVLIGAYKMIQKDPAPVIFWLQKMEKKYYSLDSCGQKKKYYDLRTLFNSRSRNDKKKIILFLFLNQTCFNGLYRENCNGEFNVPHGRYEPHPLCNEENLWQFHNALQKVEILQGSFNKIGEKLRRKNVFFYFDPPYRAMEENGKMFTMYNSSGFNDTHQQLLKEMCDRIHKRGWHFMLSNSDSMTGDGESYFENLYRGYYISRIEVTRFINTYNASQRKPKEVLITNYDSRFTNH